MKTRVKKKDLALRVTLRLLVLSLLNRQMNSQRHCTAATDVNLWFPDAGLTLTNDFKKKISPTLLVLEDSKGHSVCGVNTWLRKHEWSHQLAVWMAFNNLPACVHIRAKGAWNEGGLTVPLLPQCLPTPDVAPLKHGQTGRWRASMAAVRVEWWQQMVWM